MTTIDSGLGSLVLQLGRTSASKLAIPGLLTSVCTTIPDAIGVAGAVILLSEPIDDEGTVLFASDGQAGWIGESQRTAGNGPLPNALRSGRSLLTPDMTRIGPPEVAAAAAECGLVSSMVVPIETTERVGALQLLGNQWRPAEARHADLVRPLIEVLVARLVDVQVIRRLTEAARVAAFAAPPTAPVPIDVSPTDMATTALPVALPPGSVPSPRPRPPRHARPA